VLVAAVVARAEYLKVHPDVPMEKLVIYGTTQTHSLGVKTALILGVHFRALKVDAKDNYSLRGKTLSRALKEDRKAGLHPYMMSCVLKIRKMLTAEFDIVATVGTTSSGAVDNIKEIGSVCKFSSILSSRSLRTLAVASEPSIWLHVDAAWAGVAFALPEYRKPGHLEAINKHAHSFCTNFHKVSHTEL
jgi:aromatic-L-amino-acid/L-tryptophan decarboxylase